MPPRARRHVREQQSQRELHPAAMKASLGLSSTDAEAATLARLLATRLAGRVVQLVGDSTLRNQFVQLARVGLEVPRAMPLARAVHSQNHTGFFASSPPVRHPERPDSSNGYWGGFGWMVATTASNATLAYAKIWGCAGLRATLDSARKAMVRHQRRTGRGRWPPDALVWNFGLHLLHMFPARPVPTASLRCALSYEALVLGSMRELRAAAPSATLAWRTTNAVCDAGFVGNWADVTHAYHCDADASCGSAPASRLRALCGQRYNVSEHVCNATLMSHANTAAQRRSSLRVLEQRSRQPPARVRVLDAFALTDGRCDATVDGRHYPNLLARINERLLTTTLMFTPEAGAGRRRTTQRPSA